MKMLMKKLAVALLVAIVAVGICLTAAYMKADGEEVLNGAIIFGFAAVYIVIGAFGCMHGEPTGINLNNMGTSNVMTSSIGYDSIEAVRQDVAKKGQADRESYLQERMLHLPNMGMLGMIISGVVLFLICTCL